MVTKDTNGFYHPKNAEEISELVNLANSKNIKVRVRGAAQSLPESIYTASFLKDAASSQDINLELDQIRHVDFDIPEMQVTVGAGCNFAFDPYDPSGTSNKTNGLYTLINQKGWALQNVPDAAHQTIGGFISTGSSGATLSHSFDDSIVAIKLVNGCGEILSYNKYSDPEFYALGASMGLLGVIYEVCLQCVPAFDIIGEERTTDVDNSAYDFFGKGNPEKPSLQEHFMNTEYARTLWWPFHTLHRAISWQARKMQPSDYDVHTGDKTEYVPKPYQPVFPKILGSRLPSELIASTGFSLVAGWPKWLYILLGKSPNEISPEVEAIVTLVDKVAPYLYPFLINMYFPTNSAQNPPQTFWDHWLGSLPMDTIEFSNKLMNLDYTELWFPINKAHEVVSTLKKYYDDKGESATGFYTVEILGSKKSPFWMSPAFEQDSIRLNFMWFATDASSPSNFYYQFYELFKDKNLPFRLHWGKYLPNSHLSDWAGYIQAQYPKYADFMKFRAKMDPNAIFLNEYWQKHLEIN